MSRCAALALAVFLVASAGAADPAFDKALRDSLADVHNKGADLYNQGKDYAGAYRLYEGALRTSRPLLGHRPATQKAIDESLTAAAKEADPARKAFLLHETIEKVRADLKAAPEPKKTIEPEPKKTTTPEPEPKKATTPEPKKTTTPEPEPKRTTTPEPKKTVEPEPKKTTNPEPKKTEEPKKGAAGGPAVKGVVTYKGQPVADADLTFVSLDRPAIVALTTKTGVDGAYMISLVAGQYAVTVSATANGKAVLPARFATTDTSGLRYAAPAGESTFDISLK